MKKTLLSLGACLTLFLGTAQTQLFFEDFESGPGGFTMNTGTMGGVAGTGGDNWWVVNNSYTGGNGNVMFCGVAMGQAFTIGDTDAQPASISSQNGNYMHIIAEEANANGITNCNYGLAENTFCIFAASHFTEMTGDINTTNFNTVTLDFWWLCNADPAAVGEVWYSVDGGITWVEKTGTTFQGVSTWTNTTLTDAAWDGVSNLRFGFRFNNGATFSGADPGFAIDDVEIYGTLSSPCSPSSSTFSETACFSYTVPSGDETYTTVGTQTVMDTILNVSGCDSVMTISVTINDVDTSVTAGPDNIVANATGATFDWLNCDSAYASTGNTNNIITGTGTFAVEVTQNGCVDTSACYSITLSIEEFENGDFKIYPNPTDGNFSINLTGLKGYQIVTILDTKGSIVYYDNVSAGGILPLDLNLEHGMYIVKLVDQHGMIRRAKLMIE